MKKRRTKPKKTAHKASGRPDSEPAAAGAKPHLLELQQRHGNAAVQRMLNGRSPADIQRDPPKGGFSAETPADKVLKAADKLKKMKDFADKLQAAGKAMEKDGVVTLWFDDSEKIASGRSFQELGKQLKESLGMAEALSDASNAFVELAEGQADERLTKASGVYKKAQKILDAALLVEKLTNDEKTQAFLDDPTNKEKAYAWADEATSAFSDAANLIPDSIAAAPALGPVLKMFKGYLSAPANYVNAVKAILDERLKKIDGLTGGEHTDAFVQDGDKILWHGPLSRLYASPKAYHGGLSAFMEAHKEEGGINLETAGKELGLAHLRGLIYKYYRLGDLTEEQRDSYLEATGGL